MVQLIIKRYAAAWQLGAKSEKPKNRLPGYEGLNKPNLEPASPSYCGSRASAYPSPFHLASHEW